jgi:hypothetical protein
MSNDDERDFAEEAFNRALTEHDEAPPDRFQVYGHMLPGIAARFPVEDDHGAVLALEEALFPAEGELRESAISGPCDMAADLVANDDGEIDGYRIIIHPSGNVNAPWIAGHIEYVRDRETLPEPDEEGGVYDVAAIIRDAVATANELLNWYEHGVSPSSEPVTEIGCCGNWLPYPSPGSDTRCPSCGTVFFTSPEPVWVLIYDHRNGTDFGLYDSRDLAHATLAAIARQWWPDLDHEAWELPESPDGLPDDEVIGKYFDAMDEESWNIEPRTVQKTSSPDDRARRAGLVNPPPMPDGWRAWTSPNGVQHAVPPVGPCATCGRGRHENDQEEVLS